MAADNDNNTQLDETEQDTEEVQPLDADLPVDADAEETNADVAKGLDKKKVAGLGIVVGLVIVAGIAVFSLSKKPADDASITEPPMIAQRPPKPGTTPGTPEPKQPEKPAATVNPDQPVIGALPGQGDAEWVKGVKRPLPVPNDLQATPGLEGSNSPQVRVIRGTVGRSDSAPANSKQAAMNRLWKSGAAAKHRGDNAAARKDWNRILELDPGHAGIQQAIDKLPK